MGSPAPLDLPSLRALIPATTYARGMDLYRLQKVGAYSLGLASSHEWHIEGEVQGSERLPYECSVLLEVDDAGRIVVFNGDCSCPVGRHCKHAVALALKVVLQSAAARAAASVATAGSPPAPARPSHQVDQWLDLFDAAPTPPPAASTLDRNVFLLHVATRRGKAPRLGLSWGRSRPLRKGGWTRVKKAYPDAALLVAGDERSPAPDHECMRLIAALPRASYYSDQRFVEGQAGLLALQLAARSERLFLADVEGTIIGAPLYWGPPRSIAWQWVEVTRSGDPEPVWALRPQLEGGAAAGGQLFAGPPTLYLDPAAGLCGQAEVPGVAEQHLPLLLHAPPIPQSAFDHDSAALLERLAGLPLPPTVPVPQTLAGIAPTAHLRLAPVPATERAALGPLRAALTFDYDGVRQYWPQAQAWVLVARADSTRVLLHRQLAAELDAQAALHRLGLVGDAHGHHHVPAAGGASPWLDWAGHDYALLREAGFVVEVDPLLQGFVRHVDALDVRLVGAPADTLELQGEVAPDETASPWFDLSLGIEIDGQRVNVVPWLPQLLDQLRPTADGAELPEWVWHAREDGGYVRLPAAPLRPWLQALLDLVADRSGKDLERDALRLSRMEALRFGAALGEGAQWQGAAALRRMLQQLGGQSRLPEIAPPAGLQAELRPYQRHGLDWLQFLRAHGLGGLLADDMGLGKTLQTLAHVLTEKEAGRLNRPCLVIAPVSLLGNWQREAARFAPTLRTRVWHGLGRHAAAADLARSDLVIAPYSLLQRDRAVWQAQPWHLVVLDEAQNIKNASTHAAQVAAGLDTRHRICLSGTPMENHLGELWSLFHFLMPGFLGSQARFKTLYRTPIEQQGNQERLDQLRRRVTPFMLRRGKREVATELPDLVESVTSVTLGGAQADLYETIRLTTERSVREALRDKGLAQSQILVLDALLKLRQVCCDPRLVTTVPAATKIKQSAKLELLMELLPEMLAEGRRVLLFSQFTSMLALIEAELQARGIAWTKLTGQTQQRDRAIDRFTSGAVPLFLISLKAGGTGLNLPEADTVIHYDPWWNPAVEQQATGRAHRIGQLNRVNVYKLVAEGTIEERILALQARKAALADSLYRGAAARREPLFTEGDVAELLRPLGA